MHACTMCPSSDMHINSKQVDANVHAEIMSEYEAKLTAGYSQTYTRGKNAGVSVTALDGQHATVTSGMQLQSLLMIRMQVCKS